MRSVKHTPLLSFLRTHACCLICGGGGAPADAATVRKLALQPDLFFLLAEAGAVHPSLYPFFTFLAKCLNVRILLTYRCWPSCYREDLNAIRRMSKS